MEPKDYWKIKHAKYATEDWINKPSIFAQFAVSYFPAGSKILELGAGQGQDSRFFTRHGYKVWCTDFSDDALQTAALKAATEKLQIEFKNVDLSQPLPFADSEFDIVYSNMALHYFDAQTTEKLFKDICRIIKSGGILACLLNTMDDPEVKISRKIEKGLYETPAGLVKRYFDTDFLHQVTDEYFETIIADNCGETYKDQIKTLIRYIGRKK